MCPYVLTDKMFGQETQDINQFLSNISDIQADWSEYDTFWTMRTSQSKAKVSGTDFGKLGKLSTQTAVKIFR